MKSCRTCNRTYADESLTYCSDDGSPLSDPYDPEATQPMHSARIINPLPTEDLLSTQSSSQQVQRSSKLLRYLILLALILGGVGIALLISGNNKATPNQATDNPPLTADGVHNLISRWASAQNSKNLTAYQSCYGASFEGIKRTASGHSYSYDFNGWMSDRWQMINDGLNVEVKNVNVDISGDTAKVEFDQYYRSLKYSDWGPKVMTVKMTPAGEKIVYEELKASYPLS